MAKTVTNPSASLGSSTRAGKIDLRYVAWFSLLVAAGGIGSLYPSFLLLCVGAAFAVGCCWFGYIALRRANLEFWQMLALVGVSGYMLLNYGFENWAIHIGGFPFIIGYMVMYGSLGLAVFGCSRLLPMVWKEPAILCMFGLLGLAMLHEVFDVPNFGLYAIRDATMCLDGLFMLLGLFWAAKPNNTSFVLKWLAVLFILNMIYSFTLPWGDKIWGWSPESGIFLSVPILGNFAGSGDILLTGALFCLCLADYILSSPRWLMPALAMVQILGIAITQVRRMYLALVVVVIILAFLGEGKKFKRLLVLVPVSIVVLFLATTVGGLKITGRIGPVELSFFKDHIRSISGAEDTPGSDPESRVKMASQAMSRFYAHPIFGTGFGEALTDEIDMTNGAITRMPHNSSITYLARLGVIGFVVWIAFHFSLISRFVFAIRQRKTFPDKRMSAFVLWLFLFYVLFMITSLVEGPFEFPSGAVPFYFLMGFSMGVIRLHFSGKRKDERVKEFDGLRTPASLGALR